MNKPAFKTKTKPAPKQNPKLHYEFRDHFYPFRIFFTPCAESWRWLLRNCAPNEPYPNTDGRVTVFTRPDQSAMCVITFSEEASKRSAAEVVGLMAHEVTHVVQETAEMIGSRLDNETQAYLTQAILQWLMVSYADAGRSFRDNLLQTQSIPE